ncbi:MAG: hypothetical protein Q8L66_07965 [Caulobacter sp.]|nr:hypothetical protein [Caulobacter sp.]
MARRLTILRPQSRDARLKTLMHRMKLAAARIGASPAPAAG